MANGFTLTELTTALGAYNRERPGIFIQKVFQNLQTMDHVEVVSVRDELPIINIGGADLLRPQKRDNAWNPVADAVKFPPRILKVRPGKFDLELIPTTLWETWLGHNRKAGSADQHYMPFQEFIMNYLAGKAAEEIQNKIIWKGVFNAAGTTPGAIADGFEKIIEDSITAGGAFDVPAAQVTDVGAITAANAYDQTIAVARKLPEPLREKMTKGFMSWSTADFYNDDYTATFGAAPFNDAFNKTRIHGTNTEIVRSPGMTAGKILISEGGNLYVGMDLESDINSIQFEKNRRGIDVMFDFMIGMQVGDPRNISYGYDAV